MSREAAAAEPRPERIGVRTAAPAWPRQSCRIPLPPGRYTVSARIVAGCGADTRFNGDAAADARNRDLRASRGSPTSPLGKGYPNREATKHCPTRRCLERGWAPEAIIRARPPSGLIRSIALSARHRERARACAFCFELGEVRPRLLAATTSELNNNAHISGQHARACSWAHASARLATDIERDRHRTRSRHLTRSGRRPCDEWRYR